MDIGPNSNEAPEALLAHFFERNGYVRTPNEERSQQLGYQKYKKGWEVRLIAETESELDQIRQALERFDFRLGKPWEKGNQIVQPIYGKQQYERFLALIGEPGA